jgi:hypothetical protein
MAIPVTPVPAFPNVPRAPGVPPVLRQIGVIQNTVILLASDAVSLLRRFAKPQWGLVSESGVPLFEGANFLGVEARKDWRIPDYPIERGSFESYNKVETPFEGKVTLAVGDDSLLPGLPNIPAIGSFGGLAGSALSRRTAFLTAVEAACASLDLYTLLTPEKPYPSLNLVHYDYRRIGQQGVTLLVVDIFVQEVRTTATAQFSNVKAPEAAGAVNGGQVQPAAPPAQVSTIGSAGFG